MEPKAVLKNLLASDTLREEEAVASGSGLPVTGEQGGRLLACYLYSLERANEGPSAGAQGWLEGQKPRFMLYPAQKLCIEQALKFLSKLTKGLETAEAEAAPQPLFDSDDDF